MKKTLAAVAVLGAFAGSAMAANVELYGSVSTGLVFSHTDSVGDESAQNSVTMESACGMRVQKMDLIDRPC